MSAHLVERFVNVMMSRARLITAGDVWVATVSQIPGIIAVGADRHEANKDLYGRLHEWVLTALVAGYDLPLCKDVDLNKGREIWLETYAPERIEEVKRRIASTMSSEQFEAYLNE